MKRILLSVSAMLLATVSLAQTIPFVRARDKARTTVMVIDGQRSELVDDIITQGPRTNRNDENAWKKGNYVYNRWFDLSDINSTYISPELFNMVKKLPEMSVQGRKMDLTPAIRSLKGLYLLDFARDCSSHPGMHYSRNSTSGGLRKDIRDYLDEYGYITLMDMCQNGQYTRLYMAAQGGTVTGFVLVSLDDSFDYGRFVCLEGDMDKDKFEKILANVLK